LSFLAIMKIRVGVIGLGEAWEQRYRPTLRSLVDRFEVKAICDPISHRAEQAAHEFGAQAVDGFHAVAKRDDIDALLILSDQWYGHLPVLAACEYGRAVYCAVALQLNMEDAVQLKHKVEESGISFMAEFPRRHAPATVRLKELMATRLGQPNLLFCHKRTPVHEKATAKTKILPQGDDYRDLIELVDWCRYVVGQEPTSVFGLCHYVKANPAQSDYRMMSLDYSHTGQPGAGVVAQISSGYYFPQCWEEAVSYRPPAALQVACENGIAFIDLPTNLVWFDNAGRHQESLENDRPLTEHLLNQFHRSVTSLVRQVSGLEDAFRAVQIVLAAQHSQATGQRVYLTSTPPSPSPILDSPARPAYGN
ncbi:MAG: Gfo/Idh/MocA family oxidoreductase, partial [Pirellulales bacterium]|nr:Gfo/Idh/MocA family oxidoreductase [Pirellulales bacterium]